MPWCRFRAFLVSLPPDSAYFRRLASGDAMLSVDTHLAAMTVDALRLWLWANADPKQRGDAPAPVLAEALGMEATRQGRTAKRPDELLQRLIALRDQREVV